MKHSLRIWTRFAGNLTTVASISVAAIGVTSCGGSRVTQAQLDVTDVKHSPVKRQSIGNCWLYATSTWAESLHLTATQETVNLSESYWTYWHFYNQIPNAGKEISSGGTWSMASRIIAEHGWMHEGDFLPSESDLEMSGAQKRAEDTINRELAEGGRLHKRRDRTTDVMMEVLDEAFGVHMAELQSKVHKASTLTVGEGLDHDALFLSDVIATGSDEQAWNTVYYSEVYGKDKKPTARVIAEREKTMLRVMRALNDGQPVIMSVMVDFNALNTKPYATFDLDFWKQNAVMGRQGGHLLVLEDYTVKDVPDVGEIGEGPVSDQMKELALMGHIKTLKAKNSWGSNRPERGLKDGYTSFTIDFLNEPMPWADEEGSTDQDKASWYSSLSEFILPPNY
jgi:hypothetical protein